MRPSFNSNKNVMVYDYSDLVEKSRRWAEQACTSGWIGKDTARQLADFNSSSPETLFSGNVSAEGNTRPLIVAFMGGTGVGKSSLLNRLAGKAIARAGIERPTSREVTLFHHHSLAIQHLPEQLPLAKIKIAQHEDDAKKNIVWIDMPDFDSTEQGNKQLVLQWLPHIDVLIYVVSPERYRDEKAWRLLLAEGARHAWLFVLNQWDRGQFEQYEDFNRQLHKAGFIDPIIFKTVCAENLQADDFAALESMIISLATEHIVRQLELRSLQVHKNELKQQLQYALQLLGSPQSTADAAKLWAEQWQHATELLQQGFAWPIQNLANYYAEHPGSLPSSGFGAANTLVLWDDWAQARFDDALDAFVINASQQGIPATPLKNRLSVIREKAAKIIQTQTELAARQALSNPGNVLQRGFLKFTRVCEIILPLSAMTWVGYQVFMGFYTSNMTSTHYLGADFAIHSSLLIALTWLIPFFILKKAQPSLKKSVLNGLNKGLVSGFNTIDSEVLALVENISEQHAAQTRQLAELIEQCDVSDPATIDSDSPLVRMLVG